jgi:ribosomal subunit interface protein
MQVIIQSPHLRVSDELEQLIQSKARHLKKLHDRITKCLILVKTEKDDHKKKFCIEAELRIPVKTLFARESAESFELALHKVMHHLESQLRRYKIEREEIW